MNEVAYVASTVVDLVVVEDPDWVACVGSAAAACVAALAGVAGAAWFVSSDGEPAGEDDGVAEQQNDLAVGGGDLVEVDFRPPSLAKDGLVPGKEA